MGGWRFCHQSWRWRHSHSKWKAPQGQRNSHDRCFYVYCLNICSSNNPSNLQLQNNFIDFTYQEKIIWNLLKNFLWVRLATISEPFDPAVQEWDMSLFIYCRSWLVVLLESYIQVAAGTTRYPQIWGYGWEQLWQNCVDSSKTSLLSWWTEQKGENHAYNAEHLLASRDTR